MLDINEILIQPPDIPSRTLEINDVRLLKKTSPIAHTRIAWTWQCTTEPVDEHGFHFTGRDRRLPFSKTIGPFSHFDVFVNDQFVTRAFAMECVLDEATAALLDDDTSATIQIKGWTFEGEMAAEWSEPADSLWVDLWSPAADRKESSCSDETLVQGDAASSSKG